MSWLYSRALVEEYSAVNCSDGAPSALSSSSPMPQAYSRSDKMTDFSKLSRFGMTFGALTDDRGAELLTWYLAGFHARTSAQQDEAPASTASDRDFGTNSLASFARYDRDMLSWKIPQCSLLEDSTAFSETWPKWGLMRDGVCWEQTPSAHLTSGIASGLWPTPVARDDGKTPEAHMRMKANMPGGPRKKPTSLQVMVKGIEQGMWQTPVADDAVNRRSGKFNSRGEPKHSAQVLMPTPTCKGNYNKASYDGKLGDGLATYVKRWPTPSARDWKDTPGMSTSATNPDGTERNRVDQLARKVYVEGDVKKAEGSLNPSWVEWLMGWPIDWTSLQPIDGELHDWQQEPADVPRVSTGISARQHRLKAIGNGQVPQCAAAAWNILTGETAEP